MTNPLEQEVARRRTFAGKWAVERLIGWAMEWPALFDHAVRRIGRRRGGLPARCGAQCA